MKLFIAGVFLCCASWSVAQPVVWDNMDACSGNWTQSTLVGAGPKKSFVASRFDTAAPRSQEGGCYLAYATADTFHANSTIGWFAQQKVQSWTKRYVNLLIYSKDAGVKFTLDLADDFDGDTLTVNDVDVFRSTVKTLAAGWQEINFDLTTGFTDIDPLAGNNVRDPIIRSLTFRFTTGSTYTANDTVRIRVDQIQNSDSLGFAFLTVTPDTLKPAAVFGLPQLFNLYVTNTGSTSVLLSNTALSGANADRYAIVSAPAKVAAGVSDSIVLNYTPIALGSDVATISFQTNAVNNASITIPIVGVCDSAYGVDDKFWIFPMASTAVGTTITDYATVRNTGKVPLIMLAFDSIVGPGKPDYTAAMPFHGIIQPGETDSVKVSFTPKFTGNRPASLKLWFRKTATDLDSIFIPMLGRGGAAIINTTPMQVVDSVVLGESKYYTIKMTNYGNYSAQMTRQYFQGVDAGLFTITKPLTLPLFPTIEDSIQVLFVPHTLGLKFGYAMLVTDAANQPIVVVPFTIMVGTRQLATNPTIVFQTDTALVGSKISRSVLCQSVGTLSVHIDSVRLVNFDTTHSFSITRLPKALLNSGAFDTLRVDFAPTTPGIKIDTVRLFTNSPTYPWIDVALRGFAGARRIFASDTILADTVTIEQGYMRCFTVHDSGNLPIVISNIIIGGTNADQFTLVKPTVFPVTIPADGTDTICVRMRPTSAGDKTAQVLLISDAQNISNLYITLRAFGTTVRVIDPWEQPFSGLISAAPNPFRDVTALNISLASGEHVLHLGVYDPLGRQIRDLTRNTNDGKVDLSMEGYPKGMYFVTVVTSVRASVLPLVVE